jgi:hypothetical protein
VTIQSGLYCAAMTKMQAYAEAGKLGAGYVANVILVSHGDSARKLKGLVTLLLTGHQVQIAAFDITQLQIDGKNVSWNALDCPEVF